ncbi:MAG: polysaccharide biosynthesis tyrosine autokinase [Actinobacteria bacterium]|nr:MAG: polysaccharide biosynthesis tyrosine autokinase [Actinomycetota bacterium]
MELKDYINVLINRRWIILGTVAVVLALTLIFTFLQAPVYQSKVEILSEVSSASESVLGSFFTSALFDPDRYIQTQTEIIKTDTMAQAVESALQIKYEENAKLRQEGEDVYIPDEIPTASQLASMVDVQQVERTNIFDIIVTNTDPLLSQDVAQAYAEEYIASRQLAAIRQISEARREVWNRIQEVEDEIQQAAEQVKQYTSGNVPAEVLNEAQRAVNLWVSLYEKYITLRIAESLEQRGLEIVQPAKPGSKTSPRPTRNAILAIFLGLILGVGLAFLVEYLDDTLRTREDFEKYYDTSIIGEIPHIDPENLPQNHIIYFEMPQHPAVEGYRTLRTNLQFLNLEGETRVILFTSAGPEEGKSTVMVNLGAALSEMGKRVLLVEADLRKPVLDRYFKVSPGKGISGVLSGTIPLEEAVQSTGYNNLYVLVAGVKPPNPAELVASEAMGSIFERVKESADFVLVDSPPVLAASDAMALAPKVDGVIVMAGYTRANRDGAKRTSELLHKVNARLLGLVINNIAPSTRYGYYHYYYYTPPQPEEEETERRGFLRRKK